MFVGVGFCFEFLIFWFGCCNGCWFVVLLCLAVCGCDVGAYMLLLSLWIRCFMCPVNIVGARVLTVWVLLLCMVDCGLFCEILGLGLVLMVCVCVYLGLLLVLTGCFDVNVCFAVLFGIVLVGCVALLHIACGDGVCCFGLGFAVLVYCCCSVCAFEFCYVDFEVFCGLVVWLLYDLVVCGLMCCFLNWFDCWARLRNVVFIVGWLGLLLLVAVLVLSGYFVGLFVLCWIVLIVLKLRVFCMLCYAFWCCLYFCLRACGFACYFG